MSAVAGNYYLGVTFRNDSTCRESNPMVSTLPFSTGGEINILDVDPCSEFTGECGVAIDFGSGEFTKAGLAPCKIATEPSCTGTPVPDGCICKNNAYKKVVTPIPNFTIEVVDEAAPNIPIKRKVSCSGTIPTFYIPKGTTGHKYDIRARIPLNQASDIFKTWKCTTDGTDCIANLATNLDLDPAKTPRLSPEPVMIPDTTSGAGGGEMGNPMCTSVVGQTELSALKLAYKTKVGDCCYRTWADFNMDGVVNFDDLTVLKNYYKTNFGTAPVNALLCKSKDPLPACCPGNCNPTTCK